MIHFGQKIRCGNFTLVYITKGLKGKQQKELRRMQKIDRIDMKHLVRKTLPYLRIYDISETWSVEYSIIFPIFGAVEALLNESGKLSKENEQILLPYLTVIFADTTLLFDAEYASDKMKALEAALSRQKPSDDDDKPVIDEMLEDREWRERLAKMKEYVETHEEDENRNDYRKDY